jgi:hypothetical protein
LHTRVEVAWGDANATDDGREAPPAEMEVSPGFSVVDAISRHCAYHGKQIWGKIPPIFLQD